MEIKQAFSGQLGEVGKNIAMLHTVLNYKMRPRLEIPTQFCVRIEEETKKRLEKYCKTQDITAAALGGLILDAAIGEYLDYVESLEAQEDLRGVLLAEKAVHDHKKESKK